jgi:hypothetical protein
LPGIRHQCGLSRTSAAKLLSPDFSALALKKQPGNSPALL